MQLEALLKSAVACLLPALPQAKVTVLYGVTSAEHGRAYAMLRDRFGSVPNIGFLENHRGKHRLQPSLLLRPRNMYRVLRYPYLRETKTLFNYKELLESLLEDSTADFVTFLTDDSLFYRPFALESEFLDPLREAPTRAAFSLRHGLNIQNQPPHLVQQGNTCTWNMFHPECDTFWAYNFSIDGHIYARQAVLDLIKPLLYVNPNSFEGFVWDEAKRKRMFGEAHCFRESVLLSFPINVVQTIVRNESLGIDSNMLNQRFLEGYHLEYVHESSPRTFQQVPRALRLVKNGATIDLI